LTLPLPCCAGTTVSQGRWSRHTSALHTSDMAALVPLAHVGHWLWALYLPPILIVIGSLLWSKLKERD